MAGQYKYRDILNPFLIVHPDTLRDREATAHNPFDDRAWGREWGADRERYAKEILQQQYDDVVRKAELEAEHNKRKKDKQKLIDENPEGPYQWPRTESGSRKYHINAEGKVLLCKAEVRSCPYGEGDHFTLPDRTLGISSQTIGEWIMERKYSTLKFEYKDSRVGAEDLRRISNRVQRLGKNSPNELEVKLEVQMLNLKPVTITRRVGNTLDNRWQSHSYWVFDNGNDRYKFLGDSVSEEDIRNFAKGHFEVAYGSADPEVRKELEDEFYHRVTSALIAIESEAATVQEGSVHYAPVPLMLPPQEVYKDAEGKWIGVVNYATSAFRPSHLRTRGTSHLDTPEVEPVIFANDFEVYDNDAGLGRGSWSAKRVPEGWEVTVQGSRGDLESFTTDSPTEAAELFTRAYERRIRTRGWDRARWRNDIYSDEFVRKQALEDRVTFLKDLISEDIRGRKLVEEKLRPVNNEPAPPAPIVETFPQAQAPIAPPPVAEAQRPRKKRGFFR